MNLQYAGAFNSLYIVKNPEGNEKNDQEIIELKADKMPIAIYERMEHFTNHEVQLNKGDMVYLLSDGFVDQFGGSEDKKFLAKNLKKLLYHIRSMPMKEQLQAIKNKFEDWKGSNDQTDDITAVGFKV